MRKAVAAFAVAATVVATGVLFAPAASAATYGCRGSQIDTYPVKTEGGTQYGVPVQRVDLRGVADMVGRPSTR
ncbi:hypothetical protein POF50_025650 [Streptomyces sp. SL13]|uniref:Uncharacterized protein n=1 Tax=Streptantibioticus silvisoli TaxID=2705255 RepID=A0AA90K037_9ACTN|nr:hypothetical protein [Streptantibioticus silvisoli]MDI5965448.1 hypothetical protein [Streptantibioticus silvisoli]MDI5972686.1 hypothetical protein [Streptantibioticus silvisoli]